MGTWLNRLCRDRSIRKEQVLSKQIPYILLLAFTLGGCAGQMPPRDRLVVPSAIMTNQGDVYSPILKNGANARWVSRGYTSNFGDNAGRDAAIAAAGGWKYIRDTSDLTFHSTNDMAVYLYLKYADKSGYKSAIIAAQHIYPELAGNGWQRAIARAPRKSKAN